MSEKITIDRTQALAILGKWVTGVTLMRHSITVEAVMRHFAVLCGENADEWGLVGLLHDIDFEKYPDEHCKKARSILEAEGLGESFIHAVESHGWGLVTDVKPESLCEKTLYTIDELTGLISATALMRPSKSLSDLEVKSVKKKWKTNGFATGVNRDVIQAGADMLGADLDLVIAQTIDGMRTVAAEIGLAGN